MDIDADLSTSSNVMYQKDEELFVVSVFGRCLLSDTLELPCQTVKMSIHEMELVVQHSPVLGEHIICYLDHIGRIEGVVDRFSDGGFVVMIRATERKKQRLASRLNWLKEYQGKVVGDVRRFERMTPREENSKITLNDGRSYPVKVIDISLSGAALQLAVKPAIGTKVSLAGMSGYVVRHMQEGIAIEFEQHTTMDSLISNFGDVR